MRYLAPELIKDANALETTVSDTFSFGMLMLECITEKVPFFNLSDNAAVIHARTIGERTVGEWYPPRPDEPGPTGRVSDLLWEFMLCCWSIQCEQRPTMEEVHSFLSSN